MFISFLINGYSQKSSVVIKLNSQIPDTLYVRQTQRIKICIQNFSTNTIYISNVLALNLDYEISIKKGKDFYSIDSNCRLLPQPVIPKEGIKRIPLKRNKKIKISFFFPPVCCFGESGDYKVRFLLSYNIESKNYLTKTKWYKFTCVFH